VQQISEAKLKQIADSGTILAEGDGFVRAVRDADGRVWKQFRKKSVPSTAGLWPYARRFIRCAELLTQRSINTVAVRDVYRVQETGRHVVVYDELPGRSLRSVLETEGAQHLSDFARYVALLHGRGISFRSMHLDNVLLIDGGEFALIDVTHVTFARKPLSPWRRARNFRPFTRYAQDRALLEQFGYRRFLEEYLHAAALSDRAAAQLRAQLQRLNSHFAEAASATAAPDARADDVPEQSRRPTA
jgi:tRNA A-37 threonylcarbamoyl transferase component Bud32